MLFVRLVVLCTAAACMGAGVAAEARVLWQRSALYTTCLAVTDDGSMLAAPAGKASLAFFANDGALIRRMPAAAHQFWSLAISPDGKVLVSAHGDKTVRFSRVEDGAQFLKINVPDAPEQMAFSPDGRLLAMCGAQVGARVYSALDGTLVKELLGLPDMAYAARFTADGENLVVGTDRRIATYKTKDWTVARMYERPKRMWGTFALSPGADAYVEGPEGMPEVTWAAPMGETAPTSLTMEGRAWAKACAIGPGGAWMAVASSNGELRFWHPGQSRPYATAALGATAANKVRMATTGDGKLLYVALQYGTAVRVFETSTAKLVREVCGDSDPQARVEWLSDGKNLLSMDKDSIAAIDALTGNQVWRMAAPNGVAKQSSGGTCLAVQDGQTCRIVRAKDGKVMANRTLQAREWVDTVSDAGGITTTRSEGPDMLRCASYAPGGTLLGTMSVPGPMAAERQISADGSIMLFSACRRTVKGLEGPVTLHVFHMDTGKAEPPYVVTQDGAGPRIPLRAALSPDGKQMVIGVPNGAQVLTTSPVTRSVTVKTETASDPAFAGSGSFLSLNKNADLLFYRLADGKLVLTIPGTTRNAGISADGTRAFGVLQRKEGIFTQPQAAVWPLADPDHPLLSATPGNVAVLPDGIGYVRCMPGWDGFVQASYADAARPAQQVPLRDASIPLPAPTGNLVLVMTAHGMALVELP